MKMISFMVVTYNQKDLILYTLESIKYQVCNFLKDFSIQLMITDDCSSDGTPKVVNEWLEKNKNIFSRVDININPKNKGIVENLIAGFDKVKGDYLKMIAGDDLLPAESIRPFFELLEDNDFVMGLPLYFSKEGFTEDHLKSSKLRRIKELSNKKEGFLERLERDCFIHGSSIYLKAHLVHDCRLVDFMREFEFLEDYPMYYGIAINNPEIRYKFCDRIGILYRRTAQSAIYVRKESIFRDRIKLAKIMSKRREISFYNKLVKYNEILVFKTGSLWATKYLMIDNYIKRLMKIITIYKDDYDEEYRKLVMENKKYLNDIERLVSIVDK